MTLPNPPNPPVPSSADRATLRDRLQTMLKDRKLSGRAVEKSIGIGTGTLSKVYSGKMALTHRLLHDLSHLLGVSAESIVEATAFAHLLQTAPPTPSSAEIASLKEELDRARVEKQASDAALDQARRELASMHKELSDTNRVRRAAEDRVTVLESKQAALRDLTARMEEAATVAEQSLQALSGQMSAHEQEHSSALARVDALNKNADDWRRYALDRQQRVVQLEAYVRQLRSQIANDASAAAGAALGTALLGVALGAAIASS